MFFVKISQFFLVCIFIFGAEVATGQEKRALNQKQKENYIKAISLYEKAWQRDKRNVKVIKELAELNLLINDYKNAEKWYKQLYQIAPGDERNLYSYLKLLQYNNKQSSVSRILKKDNSYVFSDHFPTDSDIKEYASRKNIVKLSSAKFNSLGYSDIMPVFFNENDLVFMSNRKRNVSIIRTDARTEDPYYDLYIVSRASLDGNAKPFAQKIKGVFNDGPLCFNNKTNEVFYSKNIIEKDSNGKKVRRLKLFMGYYNGGDIINSVLLPFNKEGYSFTHPSISPDGSTLYFVSDLPLGYGGLDIYKVSRKGDSWGDCQNLGAKVNTMDDEISPYITEDNDIIFASKGHPGLGGYDLFIFNSLDESLVNLGAPINSTNDDFGLIIKKNEGYFTSNRINSVDNIYRYYLKSTVSLRDFQVNTQVKEDLSISFLGRKLTTGDDIVKALSMEPIRFTFDSFRLKEKAVAELNSIVELLNKYENVEIDVRAHTDSRGPKWYNQTLSERRAMAVITYLTENVKSPLRITGKGYGEDIPLINCNEKDGGCSDEEHALNRRVEIVITHINNF